MEEALKDMPKCLEILAFWLHSVHTHTTDPSDYHCLIVGTHRDVVKNVAQHAEISEQLVKTFKKCGFWSRIHQPQEDLCFFPIDNTIDNTQAENVREADPDRSSLHAAINDLGQELVDTKNEEYPIRWLKILDELQQKANSGINFMVTGPLDRADTRSAKSSSFSWSDNAGNMLHTVAKKYGIDADSAEYSSLLAFLSEVGAFLHFEDLLVIRPQWISDVLFAVVTRPQFQPQPEIFGVDIGSELVQQWLAFEATAVLGEEPMALLWANMPESTALLICIMIHFDLMFELPGTTGGSRQFLVPAMLPDTSELVEEVSGRIVKLNGQLHAELQKIAACFDGSPPSHTTPTKPLSEWPIVGPEPACYLVFEQATGEDEYEGTAQGFIPEVSLLHRKCIIFLSYLSFVSGTMVYAVGSVCALGPAK
jgi:hypothetical protein